jgi:hypothetical protein
MPHRAQAHLVIIGWLAQVGRQFLRCHWHRRTNTIMNYVSQEFNGGLVGSRHDSECGLTRWIKSGIAS